MTTKVRVDIEDVIETSVERLHPFKTWVAKILKIPVASLANYKLKGFVVEGELSVGELIITEYGEILYVIKGGHPTNGKVELVTTRPLWVMPQYFKLGEQLMGIAYQAYREG